MMAQTACDRFRREFLPGSRSEHLDRCEICRIWAEEISSLRGFGLDLPLPHGLRARLLKLSEPTKRVEGEKLERDMASVILPVPELPMPPELREKLLGIQAARRFSAKPALFLSASSAAAASLLIASILTIAMGNPAGETVRSARGISSEMGRSAETVGNLCTTAVISAGAEISRSVSLAGKAAGEMMGRLNSSVSKTRVTRTGKEPPGGNRSGEKEKSDGKRQAD